MRRRRPTCALQVGAPRQRHMLRQAPYLPCAAGPSVRTASRGGSGRRAGGRGDHRCNSLFSFDLCLLPSLRLALHAPHRDRLTLQLRMFGRAAGRLLAAAVRQPACAAAASTTGSAFLRAAQLDAFNSAASGSTMMRAAWARMPEMSRGCGRTRTFPQSSKQTARSHS